MEVPYSVDVTKVQIWFRHLADFFGQEDRELSCVRKALLRAAEHSSSVGFGVVDSPAIPKPNEGSIEALEDNAILILMPRVGGRHLVEGESLLLYIDTPAGFDVGEVTVLGEWESLDGHMRRNGVRVSIPRMIEHVQRRYHHRLTVAFDLSPRVSIEELDPPSPVGTGQVLDISESGLRVRVQPARPVLPGERFRIKSQFPAPFPSVEGLVEIVHVASSVVDGETVLGVRFLEEHHDLGRAIHQLELKRAQRLRK
jgi:hypothetical protein